MGKGKLPKFEEMKGFQHVVQPTSEESEGGHALKGKWAKEFFKNDNPITLELGCGKGEYTVALARMYPDRNFIGVDIKGARMWRGAKTALEEGLDNVGFLRTRIDLIERFFDKDEISEIWLTFSDPQPNKPRKRLSSKMFVDRYKNFLKPDGWIHLKTDSDLLFESTLLEIEKHGYDIGPNSWDLYGDLLPKLPEEEQKILNTRTHYEELFAARGHAAKYCRFRPAI